MASLSSSDRQQLSFTLVGDIHMGPSNSTRPGEETPGLMKRFVEEINGSPEVDFLVELGDRVNNLNYEKDRENALKFARIMSSLSVPYYPILGNHDIHYLTKEENREIFDRPVENRVAFVKGYKLIFLDTEEPVIEGVGGSVSNEQLKWLERELNSDDLSKIIFAHHPADDQEIRDNPHFVQFPQLAFVENREKVRETVGRGKNVLAYINGHVHWLGLYECNRIPYISVPSFTEAWPEKSGAPGMFAQVFISENGRLELTIRSLNPRRILGKFFWNSTCSSL